MKDITGNTYYYSTYFGGYSESDNTFGSWFTLILLGLAIFAVSAWYALYRGLATNSMVTLSSTSRKTGRRTL